MPVQANADNNVPWIGPRARYTVLTSTPTWLYHRMAAAALDGAAPLQAGKTADEVDPVTSGGFVEWTNLTAGGLFTALYKAKKAFILEAVDLSMGASLTIVRPGDLVTPSRTFPSTFPAKIAAGEIIKASGGSPGGYAGILVRSCEEKVW